MRWKMVLTAAAAIVTLTLVSTNSRGNETDQYLMPLDRPFADLGPYFTAVHYGLLEQTVSTLNRSIDEALANPDGWVRSQELHRLHNPQTVADMIRFKIPQGFLDTIVMEAALNSAAAKEAFPGQLTAYKQWDWIYLFAHLPIDPRNLPLVFQSSTIKVYGAYMGTDKIAHFHDLGHIYYTNMRFRMLRLGETEEQARNWVVREFSRGLVSESHLVGMWASGVGSNADLASNYVGMKFYQNLTEPTVIQGRLHPPMIVRAGDHWRLNQHVRPESDFFRIFITDHFNEALNPGLLEWGFRRTIAKRLRENAEQIVTFYTEVDGRPANGAYFDALAHQLSTYYGEDYGYLGELGENILTLGNTCLDELEKRGVLAAGRNSPDRAAAGLLAGTPRRAVWVAGRPLREAAGREYIVGRDGGRNGWAAGFRDGLGEVRRNGLGEAPWGHAAPVADRRGQEEEPGLDER